LTFFIIKLEYTMIELVDVSYSIGERQLFSDVHLNINPRDRYGLVGANGTGKTTLLRIIKGEIFPTSGYVQGPGVINIGYLPQKEIVLYGNTLIAEVLRDYHCCLDKLAEAGAEMTKNPKDKNIRNLYERCEDDFERIGGYDCETEAFKIINGLGFTEDDHKKKVQEFSSGWQMRIVLARLLLNKPDLLLLDEPTNHLDIESIAWFENYLQRFKAGLIVVTHDRYFLNKILKSSTGSFGILEIDFGKFRKYRTDYTGYLEESQVRKNRLIKQAELQQKKISEIRDFIARNRANKSKAGIVRSRMKLLARMDNIQVEREHKKVRIKFPHAPIYSRRLVELKEVSKSYDKLVFGNVNIFIDNGEKIALIGKNGAGKSTLCRIIAGCEDFDKGERLASEKLMVATFSHEIIEKVNPANTVIDEISKDASDEVSQNVRSFLGRFLFRGDDVYKKIKVLSGGERTRLIILKAMIAPSNLLILDEPTYHLDKDSTEAIKQSINDYEGTVILVTHDRDLIESFASRIVELKDGRLSDYPGNFSHYLWMKSRVSKPSLYKKKDTVDRLRQEMIQKQARCNKLRKTFSQPNVMNKPSKLKKLFEEYQRLTAQIEELEKKLKG